MDEALPIARQIAEALEAAHEQGSSIAISSPRTSRCARRHGEGLDFGLAKAIDPAGGDERDRDESPTIINPATLAGVDPRDGGVMSPEQAGGKA